VLGGTAGKGDWSTTVSLSDTKTILDNIAQVFPSIYQAPIVSTAPCVTFHLQPVHRTVFPWPFQYGWRAPYAGCCTINCSVLQESAWVGLRPGRAPLRLESEVVGNTPVVHCYGHGGSGITLGMGCAEDVVVNHVAPRLGLPLRPAGAKMAAPVAAVKVEFRPRSRL
jgi:glycine/D-amino acid oxidase-like deaminating enzyme